ncbi:MAG TPA: hypothetical protein VNL77_12590 [Roseiflexaceae bacterium]|nr:hypothetical protein [Roseiflexaceae bacterium]
MDALLYLPTAQAIMWNQPDAVRAAVAQAAAAAHPPRAYALRASITLSADHSSIGVDRPPQEPPLLIFEALELPLPLVARPRDYWYPRLTEQVRPERFQKQPRSDALVVYGPPRQPLSAVRDSVPVHDPRTGHYLGRAFYRVDRQGFWGCWSDDTENRGPCLTLAELTALLNAARGVFAD